MNNIYDVCVVGAGPSGATCAWYLAKAGHRVVLLERKQFPREKLCGEAVCTRAQLHLKRMGVLQEILAAGQGKWAEVGGFVSPRGLRFIGNSAPHTDGSLVIAIKRIILDEKVARAADTAGATLVENYAVAGATFDKTAQCWTIHPKSATHQPYQALVVVAADGASSYLARSLGMVTTAPDAVCSRAYVKAGTSNFDADGVVFYPRQLLPGYCALFREAGDELNFCCYIIPGGQCTSADLRRMHASIVADDPHVRQALGPNAAMDPMRGAPLRLGGIPKSYADHLLIVGDAAGHIDPLTGEGIQYGMDGAEIAANTISEGLAAGNLSAAFLRRYQDRWMKSFGWDFTWSKWMARFCGRFPVFLDACAAVTQRRGPAFLAEWAEVMTGAKPKRAFLRPSIAAPILLEAGRQWFGRGAGLQACRE